MDPADTERAIAAAMAIAQSLGLDADEAVVLQSSNKLALRIRPSDVFARVAPTEAQHARFEVGLAQHLAHIGCPTAVLDPRVEPRGYERDGFEVTFWTFYEPVSLAATAADYATALQRLHLGMRGIAVAVPHFTDRVTEAAGIVTSPDRSPDLADADQALIAGSLRRALAAIVDRRPVEQLLHGEPHPGNVLATADGTRFIDLETCCRGPIEFDLAHVPVAVCDRYPDVDDALLGDCRELVLAMVAAWRVDPSDRLPDGGQFGRTLIAALRAGPPWPTLDVVFDG